MEYIIKITKEKKMEITTKDSKKNTEEVKEIIEFWLDAQNYDEDSMEDGIDEICVELLNF